MMTTRKLPVALAAAVALASAGAVPTRAEVLFSEHRIYIEFNQTANDLGYHVSLDGEDWKKLKIINPKNRVIFEVNGKGPYKNLGMTELFFEGAEPNLDDFPLEDLSRSSQKASTSSRAGRSTTKRSKGSRSSRTPCRTDPAASPRS